MTYGVFLFVEESPLRVIAKNRNDHSQRPQTFKETRALLQSLIAEVETQICWAMAGQERWAQIEEDSVRDQRDWLDEMEEGKPERLTEVNFGDSPGRFKAWE